MPSFKQMVGLVAVGLATVGSAFPAIPKFSSRTMNAYSNLVSRQNPATGLPDGLTDVDVLQFALTLEFLEAAFYQQGFAKFPDSDFAALGLSPEAIVDLKSIGKTEEAHVSLLLTAIATSGAKPVAPCQYNFGFTDAAGMVATAAILEQVGVSAYLGAAPILTTPSILTVAGEILTVEARHQTFIRTASKIVAVPSPFDTPLGVRSVFSLAAGFITSCPEGSNLAITPFEKVTLEGDVAAASVPGAEVKLQTAAQGGQFCAFTNGGLPAGGTAFTPFVNGACTTPQGLAGATYVHITSAAPPTGGITDGITVAGPMFMAVS
ncbi:ferritin-like domain-containing protein [Bisporella sp. PMI_857]|nr:ferritin-like domain-containing protein [Bisporella sp. PMI_857]